MIIACAELFGDARTHRYAVAKVFWVILVCCYVVVIKSPTPKSYVGLVPRYWFLF